MRENKKITPKHFKINEDWIQKSNQNLVMDLLRKQFKPNKSK
jgi:hypothetical protein